MQFSFRFLLAAILMAPAALQAQPPKTMSAVVESTLKTAGGQIRQFAFDGNADSYFASAGNPGKDDHFTLIFDQPVAIRAIDVTTGNPKGGDALDAGVLESSTDGKTFEKLADFADGIARVKSDGAKIKALRVRPAGDMKHPLAIREFTIVSEPKVAVFKYPIEFIIDVSDAPEMKEWAEKVARVCERNYTMINDELASEGFKPRTQITMTLKNDYKGVAAAGGGRITGSVKYFKSRPEDVGAMVHETVHCVQAYRVRGPGWLVEGIADYVRFFKYEPGKIGKLAKDPHFDGSYRTSAAFLNFVTTQYDKDLVKKVNKAMREGEYKEEIWKTLTKKTLKELDEEWRASMKKGAVSFQEEFVQAKDQPKKTDPPAKGKTPPIEGEPSLRIHPVPGGNAEAIAKLLQDIFPAPKTRIVALGPNQIAAWADPQTHIELAKQRPLAPGVTVVIALDELNPAKTAAMLKAMFGEPKTGGPFIEADNSPNSLRIRGSAEQVDEVKQVLATLTKDTGTMRGTRMITLDEGSAATVAEALYQLFPRIRDNPINLNLPGSADPPRKTSPPEKKDAKPGKVSAPVSITAFGNRLIVTSADPEALEVIVRMVRILVESDTGGHPETIRLTHAKAVNVAKVLDEVYNGPAGKAQKRIRVVADPATNSILIEARPVVMMSIRDLVAKSLDIPQAAGGDR